MSEPEIDPKTYAVMLQAVPCERIEDGARLLMAYAAEREAKLREMLTNAQEAAVTLGAEVAKLREERDEARASLALAIETIRKADRDVRSYADQCDAAIKALREIEQQIRSIQVPLPEQKEPR